MSHLDQHQNSFFINQIDNTDIHRLHTTERFEPTVKPVICFIQKNLVDIFQQPKQNNLLAGIRRQIWPFHSSACSLEDRLAVA